MRLSAGMIVAGLGGALPACTASSSPPEPSPGTAAGEPLVVIDSPEADLTWSEAGSDLYTLPARVAMWAHTGADCAPGAYMGIASEETIGPAGEVLYVRLETQLPELPHAGLQWELVPVPAEPEVVIPPTMTVTYLSERDDSRDLRWRGWYGGSVTIVDWSATRATLEIAGAGLTACDSEACWAHGPITLTLESWPDEEIPTDEYACTEGGAPDPTTGLCVPPKTVDEGEPALPCSTLPW